MSRCQRGSQRSYGVREPCLVHGDHIHIALAQDQIVFSGRPCRIQSVEIPAFIEDLRLRGIQIFRFSVSHDTSAKSNDTVIDIHDRKDDTVPEFIIHPMLLIHVKQPGFPKQLITVVFVFQISV